VIRASFCIDNRAKQDTGCYQLGDTHPHFHIRFLAPMSWQGEGNTPASSGWLIRFAGLSLSFVRHLAFGQSFYLALHYRQNRHSAAF
jgi:hypothetical protein